MGVPVSTGRGRSPGTTVLRTHNTPTFRAHSHRLRHPFRSVFSTVGAPVKSGSLGPLRSLLRKPGSLARSWATPTPVWDNKSRQQTQSTTFLRESWSRQPMLRLFCANEDKRGLEVHVISLKHFVFRRVCSPCSTSADVSPPWTPVVETPGVFAETVSSPLSRGTKSRAWGFGGPDARLLLRPPSRPPPLPGRVRFLGRDGDGGPRWRGRTEQRCL